MLNTDQIISVIKKSGLEILKIYKNYHKSDIITKEDNSPLTKADIISNNIITTYIEENFDMDVFGILSEETKEKITTEEKDYCFIIDPLDGTKEFIKKTGEFTINLALSHKGSIIEGYIYAPILKKLYYAKKNEGAYLLENDKTIPIQVSNRISNLIALSSKSHQSKKEIEIYNLNKNIIKEFEQKGSSLKGCMIAEGLADVYYRFGLTSEWDTAAMQIIVEESGGIFKQMDGSNMRYNRGIGNHLNKKGFYIVNNKKNIFI